MRNKSNRPFTPSFNPSGVSGMPEDGHKPGILSPGFMEDTFSHTSFPSAVKEFTHPGKEPAELLMRTVFKDERDLNAAVLFLARCQEFNLTRHKQLLLNRIAGATSIRGERAKMLLQAVVGQLASSTFGYRAPNKHGDSE